MRVITRCELEDGRILEYSMALPLTSKTEVSKEFRYMGSGVIHSVNTMPYRDNTLYHFYTTNRKKFNLRN